MTTSSIFNLCSTDKRKPVKNAVILAGGTGSRMGQVSESYQKCLTLINGRPLLDYVIERVLFTGCENILLVANHLREQLEGFVDKYKHRGSITVVHTNAKGTAGALKSAESFITTDAFFYLHGDLYFNEYHLLELQTRWQSTPASVVIGASEKWYARTHPYFSINESGTLHKIWLPGRGDVLPRDALCSMETMILNKTIFDVIWKVGDDKMLADVIMKVQDNVEIVVHHNSWFHLENLDDLKSQPALGLFY